MRKIRSTAVASALALALALSAGTASAQFSNAYFFGDSLSDSGNYVSKNVLPAGTGKFTTNPGPVWTEVFASYFGFAASPSSQGGTNHAWGGARVTSLPGVVDSPLSPLDAVPVATQVQQFLAKGPLDRNALYSLQGGGNDFFFQFGLLLAGLQTPAGVQAAVAQAATDLAAQATILKAAGANYVVVWGVPDLGTSLSGKATGQGPTLTALSGLYNQTLWGTLDALNVQTIRLNSAALQNEILNDPAYFGIKNVTSIACTTPSNVTIAECDASSLVSPDAPNTYFWANGAHPTTAGHAILAQYATSVVIAPQQMAILGQQPLDVEKANWRTLDGRMVSALNGKGAPGKFQAWAAYDYGNPDYSSYQSGNAKLNTITVGGDMKLSDRMLAGVQFAYSESKGNYGTLSSKLNEPMGTFYLGFGEGPWYVGATLGWGSLDYSTNRDITLGAAVRTETGDTDGWQFVGRLLGGYWFTHKDWVHGPTVKFTYQDIRVSQFSENGSNSTTMTFGQQDVTSFQTSLGWQAAGQMGAFRPFGRVTWEYDSDADTRNVTASVYGTGSGSFSVPSYKPDNSYALFNLGASTDFGKVTGFFSGSASAGKSDGEYWGVTVGIRVPL